MRDVEKALATNRKKLEELEARLADEALYADPDHKDELTRLVRDQGEVKSTIDALEWEWLEASEVPEKATQ